MRLILALSENCPTERLKAMRLLVTGATLTGSLIHNFTAICFWRQSRNSRQRTVTFEFSGAAWHYRAHFSTLSNSHLYHAIKDASSGTLAAECAGTRAAYNASQGRYGRDFADARDGGCSRLFADFESGY